MENYHFLEKMSHFDRERIPERVVHARGAVAFGYLEATGTRGDEPIANYTRAKLFNTEGKRTDLAIRFSTVIGGLREAEAPTADECGPEFTGRITRKRIPRTDDYEQVGQRYQLMEQWEKDDLVADFVTNISEATREVQERMVWHFLMCDDELGLRVGEGLGISPDDVRHLEPRKSQTLSPDEETRRANLGKNGPRNVEGLTMTHCVPDVRVVLAG